MLDHFGGPAHGMSQCDGLCAGISLRNSSLVVASAARAALRRGFPTSLLQNFFVCLQDAVPFGLFTDFFLTKMIMMMMAPKTLPPPLSLGSPCR